MAEVSSSGMYAQQPKFASYFPNIPPQTPFASLSYPRATQHAPYTALMGVVVDGRIPNRHPVTPRCRVRKQVGLTNRWRLPEALGSDLLGSAQAIKAVSTSYNQTIVNIMTAESPQMNMNLDVTRPYTFRQPDRERPFTQPAMSVSIERGLREKGAERSALSFVASIPTPPATAPPTRLRRQRSVGPVKTFTPVNARPTTPKDIFLYHSKRSKSVIGPDENESKPLEADVLLKCLNMDWELHRPFMQKSRTLTDLLRGAEDPKPQLYYKSAASETLDNYIKKSNFYSNEYREMSNRLSVVEGVQENVAKGLDHPSHTCEERINSVTVIQLDVQDPLITKTAMAVALGNLYHDDVDVQVEDVSSVLAAASVLQFKALINGCVNLMLKNINYRTVCKYHQAATLYQQEHVVLACERWLELNLVPQLSSQIQLREIPMDLLQKILKSNRLFLTNEYSVYRTLAYWLFMQLNPHLQLMPSHSTVLSYFNSLPKTTSFLERDDGLLYATLFSTVRLHGIMDTGNIQDMQLMNIMPQEDMIKLLSQHYQSLQGGGDMFSKNFNTAAIRHGFIIEDEPLYHSEVLSLHGFHFELKAVGSRDGLYSFYMQRLKPGDPILSFRQCERHTFSMRADREVKYCITVQYVKNFENMFHSTGIQSQKFGLGEKTSRSEMVKLESLQKPIYVSFSVLFPSS